MPSTPELAGDLEERRAVTLDVLREEDVWRIDDGFAKRLLANSQLGAEQVAALELEQVECDEGHRVLGGGAAHIGIAHNVDSLLHALERRPAVGAEDDELAVDERLTSADPRPDRLGLRVASGLVTTPPARDAHPISGHAHHRSDAVVLELEQPAVPGKRVIHGCGEHRRRRLNERRGRSRLLRGGGRGGRGRGGGRSGSRAGGAAHLAGVATAVASDLRQASAGFDRNVELDCLEALHHRNVALLDHQPVLVAIAAAAVLPAALTDVDERELAGELGALEAEFDVPPQARALEVIGGLLHPLERADVPQHHRASAVSRRDDALELAVIDRVVLGLDGESLLGGIEARAPWNRPREQDPVVLQPEVEMHSCGAMFLDAEPAPVG